MCLFARPGDNKSVTDTQLYMVIGVPVLCNAGMIGLTVAKFISLSNRLHRIEELLDLLAGAINEMNKRITRVEIKLGLQP